jgi:RNA polymerase sigma factor (sigma-70 family)
MNYSLMEQEAPFDNPETGLSNESLPHTDDWPEDEYNITIGTQTYPNDQEILAHYYYGASATANVIAREARRGNPHATAEQNLVIGAALWVLRQVRENHAFPSTSHTLSDTYQNAFYLMCHSLTTYDPDKSSLITYVNEHFDSQVSRPMRGLSPDINDGDIIRIKSSGEKGQANYYKIKARLQKLQVKFEQPIEVDDLCDFGVSEDEIIDYKKHLKNHEPLHASVEAHTLPDTDPSTNPEESIISTTHTNGINEALGCLNEREKIILRKRLAGDNLADIALGFGITSERVRQLEQEAYRKLREIPDIVDIINSTSQQPPQNPIAVNSDSINNRTESRPLKIDSADIIISGLLSGNRSRPGLLKLLSEQGISGGKLDEALGYKRGYIYKKVYRGGKLCFYETSALLHAMDSMLAAKQQSLDDILPEEDKPVVEAWRLRVLEQTT